MKNLFAVALALAACCMATGASAQSTVSGVAYGASYQYQHSWRVAPRDFFRDRGCCLHHHDFFRDRGRYHWPGDVYRGGAPRYHVPPGYRLPPRQYTVVRVQAQYIAVEARKGRR